MDPEGSEKPPNGAGEKELKRPSGFSGKIVSLIGIVAAMIAAFTLLVNNVAGLRDAIVHLISPSPTIIVDSTTTPTVGPTTTSILASGEDSQGAGLHCDILQVKRVSGDALLIRWRFDGSKLRKAYWIPLEIPYYIDPAANRKYSVLMAPGGWVSDFHADWIAPDQQGGAWAKFPAPPMSTKKISIYLPGFLPIEDVPVSE